MLATRSVSGNETCPAEEQRNRNHQPRCDFKQEPTADDECGHDGLLELSTMLTEQEPSAARAAQQNGVPRAHVEKYLGGDSAFFAPRPEPRGQRTA